MSAAARRKKLDVRSHEELEDERNIDASPRASRPPPSQREARARSVVSRARRSHRSLPLETRPEPRVVRGLPERSVQNARPPVATRAMSDSSAQRVRVGPFAVSVDKQKPLIGAKISKVRRVGPVVHSRTRATRLSPPPRPRTKGAARPHRAGGRDDDDRLSRTTRSASRRGVVAFHVFAQSFQDRSIRERSSSLTNASHSKHLRASCTLLGTPP
jgi:hypothetical protein